MIRDKRRVVRIQVSTAGTQNHLGHRHTHGTNTYTGNTTISQGTVSLTGTGAFRLKISNGGLSNSISMASGATLTLSGVMNLDLNGLTDTAGTWNLITGAGTKTYDPSTFMVKINGGSTFTKNANRWTSGHFTFDTNNGVVTAVPDPSAYGLLGADALAGVALVRRRRRAR